MKLLFEVWGNFKNWKEVNYVYEGKKFQSKTTLPLLLECISPDDIFLIVSDTLIENLCESGLEKFDYDERIKKVEESVYQFVGETSPNRDYFSKLNIFVLPGLGTFENTQFIGSPKNFYATLHYTLVKRILQILDSKKEEKKIEVTLDITHGINYMTVMTYRAIKDICEILAHFYCVKFKVLNSDPTIGSKNLELFINEIEKINVTPRFNFQSFNEKTLIKPHTKILDEEKKIVNEKLNSVDWENRNEISHKAKLFSGSFLNGLVIHLIKYFPVKESLSNLLEKASLLMKENIDFKKENSKSLFVQKAELTNTFVSLNQVFLLSSLIENIYGISETEREELNFSYLKRLKDLFKHNRTIYQRLEKELRKLENNGCGIQNDFKDYGAVVSEDYEPSLFLQFDERNFFAHCGFGYNIIQVKKEDNEIILKVKENFNKDIEKHIESNLPKGD